LNNRSNADIVGLMARFRAKPFCFIRDAGTECQKEYAADGGQFRQRDAQFSKKWFDAKMR
jgi:hypothetical protein